MSQPQHPSRHGCPICHITKPRLPFCIHRKHQRIIAMMALFQYERDLIEHLAGELGDFAAKYRHRHRRLRTTRPRRRLPALGHALCDCVCDYCGHYGVLLHHDGTVTPSANKAT